MSNNMPFFCEHALAIISLREKELQDIAIRDSPHHLTLEKKSAINVSFHRFVPPQIT
jgi:hypothetical protein